MFTMVWEVYIFQPLIFIASFFLVWYACKMWRKNLPLQPQQKPLTSMPLSLVITSEQKIKVTLNPVTAAGNPAQVDTLSIAWGVTEGDAVVELIEGEPYSAYLISGGAGVANVIEVSADADLGEGVKTISDMVALNVVAAEAAFLGLIAAEAEAK